VLEFASASAVSDHTMSGYMLIGSVSLAHTFDLGNQTDWFQWSNRRTTSEPMLAFVEAGGFVAVGLNLQAPVAPAPEEGHAAITALVTGRLVPVP
jgi:hypothetical protein